MLLFVLNLDQLQGQNPEILGGLDSDHPWHGLQWESKFLHTLVQHTDSQMHWQFASHTHKSTIKIQGDLYVPVLKHCDLPLENLFCGLQGQRKRSGQSGHSLLISAVMTVLPEVTAVLYLLTFVFLVLGYCCRRRWCCCLWRTRDIHWINTLVTNFTSLHTMGKYIKFITTTEYHKFTCLAIHIKIRNWFTFDV